MDYLWSPPPPPPDVADSTLIAFATANPPLVQAAIGVLLLTSGKHFRHTVLLLQTIRAVAWPSLMRAASELSVMLDRTRAAVAAVSPEEMQDARRRLAMAKDEYSTLARAAAAARAQWRNGTLDERGLSDALRSGKQAAARLAAQAEGANAALSGLSAAAATIEPSELYAALSAPLAALGTAVTVSTSASAVAIVHGVSIGSDARRMFGQLVAARSLTSGDDADEGARSWAASWAALPRSWLARVRPSELSPLQSRWSAAALDALASAAGVLLAARAKGAAATLSASELGASAVVAGARGLGFDAVMLAVTGGAAEEDADLDAEWQLVVALFVALSAVHQLRSPRSLPLLLRMLIWPVLLLERWLEALSVARAAGVAPASQGKSSSLPEEAAAAVTAEETEGEAAGAHAAEPEGGAAASFASRRGKSPAKVRAKAE